MTTSQAPVVLSYLDTVNHHNFREASKKVDEARKLLEQIMHPCEAFDWIKAWASGAGDGIE
jgi:hypothetical protein